jgi:hypothetical protein
MFDAKFHHERWWSTGKKFAVKGLQFAAASAFNTN